MIDTLRSDHLSSYGYEPSLTPFLSRLASEGIQLQGYSASSWTRSSVATFLTGLHPQRHQAIGRSDHLPENAPFLPQVLRSRGFETAAYVSNGNVGREVGFGRNWDVFEEFDGRGKPDAAEVTDIALRLAAKLEPPFLLYVHYIDPHDPYVPRQPWGRTDVEPSDYVQPKDFLRKTSPVVGAELDLLRSQYDGEIHEMDAELSRLVAGLGKQGQLDGTLVVVTSDHGEEFGEHGSVAHGQNLHEEVIRVPFILWMQSGLDPYQSPAPFHHVDFLPTMLDALGQRPLDGVDGQSRWDQITSKRANARRALLFHLDLDQFGELAAVSGTDKAIYRVKDQRRLFFDLLRDPKEQAPISAPDPSRRKLLTRAGEMHTELSRGAKFSGGAGLSNELAARLQALGYAWEADGGAARAERNLPLTIDLSD